MQPATVPHETRFSPKETPGINSQREHEMKVTRRVGQKCNTFTEDVEPADFPRTPRGSIINSRPDRERGERARITGERARPRRSEILSGGMTPFWRTAGTVERDRVNAVENFGAPIFPRQRGRERVMNYSDSNITILSIY